MDSPIELSYWYKKRLTPTHDVNAWARVTYTGGPSGLTVTATPDETWESEKDEDEAGAGKKKQQQQDQEKGEPDRAEEGKGFIHGRSEANGIEQAAIRDPAEGSLNVHGRAVDDAEKKAILNPENPPCSVLRYKLHVLPTSCVTRQRTKTSTRGPTSTNVVPTAKVVIGRDVDDDEAPYPPPPPVYTGEAKTTKSKTWTKKKKTKKGAKTTTRPAAAPTGKAPYPYPPYNGGYKPEPTTTPAAKTSKAFKHYPPYHGGYKPYPPYHGGYKPYIPHHGGYKPYPPHHGGYKPKPTTTPAAKTGEISYAPPPPYNGGHKPKPTTTPAAKTGEVSYAPPPPYDGGYKPPPPTEKGDTAAAPIVEARHLPGHRKVARSIIPGYMISHIEAYQRTARTRTTSTRSSSAAAATGGKATYAPLAGRAEVQGPFMEHTKSWTTRPRPSEQTAEPAATSTRTRPSSSSGVSAKPTLFPRRALGAQEQAAANALAVGDQVKPKVCPKHKVPTRTNGPPTSKTSHAAQTAMIHDA
ncbi:hypothetical protein CDD83_4473 [Cordyceps sp. RAO-2017]|nr:hypothetical protein CDD83_4473 [Cordyceps sp. RAO-2017]